jgi:AcrR family transcriptional regulator
MTSAGEPRRLRADAARNRQALIDTAQRLFASRGLAVTLDDIAAEAGVNVATAYRHFANKHELAAAFLQDKIDRAIAIAEEAADAEDPWQGLIDFLRRVLDLIAANRDLHDAFTPGYANPWLEQLDARIDPILHRLLERAQEAGAVRADLATGDLSVVVQMLAAVGDIRPDADVSLIPRYLELVLAGLRPSDVPLPGSAPPAAEVRAATTSRPRPASR